MMKLYISSVIIWFLIIVCFSLSTKKIFLENIKKYNEALNKEEVKKMGYIKTTLFYLMVSFVPVFRLLILVSKFYIVFNIDKLIEFEKEKK